MLVDRDSTLHARIGALVNKKAHSSKEKKQKKHAPIFQAFKDVRKIFRNRKFS